MPLLAHLRADGALDWTIHNASGDVGGWTHVAADPTGDGVVVVGNVLEYDPDSIIRLTWGDGHTVDLSSSDVESGWLILRLDSAGRAKWTHIISGPPDEGGPSFSDVVFAEGRVVLSMTAFGRWLAVDGVTIGEPLGNQETWMFGAQLAFDEEGNVDVFRIDGQHEFVTTTRAERLAPFGRWLAEAGYAAPPSVFDGLRTPVVWGREATRYGALQRSDLSIASLWAAIPAVGEASLHDLAASPWGHTAHALLLKPDVEGVPLALSDGSSVPMTTDPAVLVFSPGGALECAAVLDTHGESISLAANGVVWGEDAIYAVARWKDEVTFPDGTEWVTADTTGSWDGVLFEIPFTYDGSTVE